MNIDNSKEKIEEYEDKIIDTILDIVVEDEDSSILFETLEEENNSCQYNNAKDWLVNNVEEFHSNNTEFMKVRAKALNEAYRKYKTGYKKNNSLHKLYIDSYIKCLKELM